MKIPKETAYMTITILALLGVVIGLCIALFQIGQSMKDGENCRLGMEKAKQYEYPNITGFQPEPFTGRTHNEIIKEQNAQDGRIYS